MVRATASMLALTKFSVMASPRRGSLAGAWAYKFEEKRPVAHASRAQLAIESIAK
jgi:hypothetical protein